jgi:hypothetical protein
LELGEKVRSLGREDQWWTKIPDLFDAMRNALLLNEEGVFRRVVTRALAVFNPSTLAVSAACAALLACLKDSYEFGFIRKRLDQVVVRSHVADAQDLVKSITSDALGNFKVGQDITQYQSEQRAFHVSDSILRSGNQSEKYNCGLSECVLGTGLKNPGQVTSEVDRILQNNYKSSINKQPLTPANQGGAIVPH